jgi:pSer/pThr/pTyr-binding forkhead associated (FHA) protein
MIKTACQCGREFAVGENAVNTDYRCPSCNRVVRMVCGEQLADGAGAGDFDTRLVVISGPSKEGHCLILGGVADIEIGKMPGKHIHLEAQLVSRNHCRLVRLDFGPSRWKIVDNKSTNGLFVNRERVVEHELADGDEVNIGGFALQYSVVAAAPPPPPVEEEVEEQEEEVEEEEAAPRPVRKPPRPGARPTLGYARPGTAERFLSNSEPGWVKKLKLASSMLLFAVCMHIFSALVAVFVEQKIGILIGIAATLLDVVGAWLLTEREPEVEESSGHTLLRMSLRITSVLVAVAGLSVATAQLMGNPALLLGGLADLAGIPQFFLFLLLLRILALRLPNETLATQCLVVMIGLPASIAVMFGGTIYIAMTRSVGFGTIGVCASACGIIVFAIWYLVILVWFQRSLNWV